MKICRVMAGLALLGWSGACSEPMESDTGGVQVTVATSGDSIDADGYVLDVDDGASSEDVSVDDTIDLVLDVGTHSLELTGMADNCVVDGDNPVSVTVTADEAASADFAVTCSAS